MKVAIVGVGLIGGSIGLAARRRLGAHVCAWDPDEQALGLALERGAIDEAVDNTMDIEEADIAVAAVPVDVLAEEVRELCTAVPRAVVTDVGSTKRALVEAIEPENFIGGHPLAGAQAAGVAHAREDLFDGATWYLTPRAETPGVLYERLARFVAGLGAVPTAVAPAEHDRLMAAVSHLPHVVANLLVAQVCGVLGDGTVPAIGPSFRDATRVAGAHPALWEGIYRANRDALLDQVDELAAGLAAARERIAADDDLAGWQRHAADQREGLLRASAVAADQRELRVAVPNRPGVVAELALALGRAGINISDMSLAPEPDNRTGVVGLWVAAATADRAVGLIGTLGYPVTT